MGVSEADKEQAELLLELRDTAPLALVRGDAVSVVSAVTVELIDELRGALRDGMTVPLRSAL